RGAEHARRADAFTPGRRHPRRRSGVGPGDAALPHSTGTAGTLEIGARDSGFRPFRVPRSTFQVRVVQVRGSAFTVLTFCVQSSGFRFSVAEFFVFFVPFASSWFQFQPSPESRTPSPGYATASQSRLLP